MIEIENILNMYCRNEIIFDMENGTPIGKYGRINQDQTEKYKLLKNGAYYIHYDWYKNHKARNKVMLTLYCCGKYRCKL